MFTVNLVGASGLPVTVNYNTANLTANAGVDYVAAQGTLLFAPGVTSQTVTVTILGVDVPKDPSQFALLLSNPVNTTIATTQAVATITNDVPGPTLTISNAQAVQPDSGSTLAEFTVTLSEPSDQIVTVGYATADGTAVAQTNYLTTTGTLTFAPGQVSQTIDVPVLGNTTPGPNLTFSLSLLSPTNATLAQATATGTIIDPNVIPGITVTGGSVTATSSSALNALFTITLSEVSKLPITVNYYTQDGTAIAGTDYVASNGQLTFAPGITTATVNVLVNTVSAPSLPKQFTLNLSGPTNATITTGTATETINNSIAAPTVSVANVSVTAPAAGTTTASFVVQLSGPSTLPITVGYATADNTAIAGKDYVAASGVLVFNPGQTIQTVNVTSQRRDGFRSAADVRFQPQQRRERDHQQRASGRHDSQFVRRADGRGVERDRDRAVGCIGHT